MASKGRRLSEEEREVRRVADRERLKDATKQLLSSEGWARWVSVRAHAGMRRYSPNNQLLIALQRPTATFVAGFHAWKDLGYRVRKGEKGLRILAPVPLRHHDRDDQQGLEPGGRRELDADARDRPVVGFRTIAVFDRSQVDPIPNREQAPLHPPHVPLAGDSHAHLLDALADLAIELGYRIETKTLDGTADGWCDTRGMVIVENANLPANARVRVRVHELAHALGVSYRDYGRERAEVIVDTATFIACASVGFDTAGESIPYVATWGESGGLDAVTEFATTIDRIAERLEDAMSGAAV